MQAPISPTNTHIIPRTQRIALLIWVGVQALILTACVLHYPLWARIPLDAERLSLIAVIATQLISAALLFDALLDNLVSTFSAIACTWPFVTVAGFCAAASVRQITEAEVLVAGTLLILHLLLRLIRLSPARFRGELTLLLRTLLILLAIGAPLLTYLRAE